MSASQETGSTPLGAKFHGFNRFNYTVWGGRGAEEVAATKVVGEVERSVLQAVLFRRPGVISGERPPNTLKKRVEDQIGKLSSELL